MPNIVGSSGGARGGSHITNKIGVFSGNSSIAYSIGVTALNVKEYFVMEFNANKSSTVYKDNAKVVPNSLKVTYCIKF